LAARDFSRAGETFIAYDGQVNEILYSSSTPLGYHAYVSIQRLQHIEKHPVAARYKNDLAYILNNPDLITPNYEELDTHIFYKVFPGKLLLATPVNVKNEIRYVATMHKADHIKGLNQNRISARDFLYLRGGFKWKKWK
jgi:hypothetical protein